MGWPASGTHVLLWADGFPLRGEAILLAAYSMPTDVDQLRVVTAVPAGEVAAEAVAVGVFILSWGG